jgi:hypothetical protein
VAPTRLQNLIRSAEPESLDLFLVAALLTVLTLRVYLKATNYPKIGGGGLHIAHVLWGGLGMVVAIMILLTFVTSGIRPIAALIGGLGFGAFIDELGKFVTSDNNYFFKPTAALIYVVFAALVLAVRWIRRSGPMTPTESLVNAIELSSDLAAGRLSSTDRDRALALLAAADQTNPLVPALRQEFLSAPVQSITPSRLARIAAAARRRYVATVATQWFRRTLAGLFAVQALGVGLLVLYGLIVAGAAATGSASAQTALVQAERAGPIGFIEGTAALVAAGFTVVGIIWLPRSRVRAYHAFELAILVDLLLAQPFMLLDAGFYGFFEVLVDLALLATLRYMQQQERRIAVQTAAAVVSVGLSATGR